jgi:hypothetical protein
MTECKRTRSIIHGWRLITLVLLASPTRSAYARRICHTMPADDSVRNVLTAIKSTTSNHVLSKWVLECIGFTMYFYDDNHTTRERGIGLNTRTSEKHKSSVKKQGKDVCACRRPWFLSVDDSTPLPINSDRPIRNKNRETRSSHTHILFSHHTHIHFSLRI